MTLIEAMVAVAILAIVMTLVWGGFAQTAKNKQRAQERVDRAHVIRAAMERMTRELAAAYVSAQLNEDLSLNVMNTCFVGVDRGSRDRLDFTSFSHRRLYRDAHESDQNEISYFLARHPQRRETQVLARREQNRIDEDPQTGGRVEIMVEDVTELELEFLDPLSAEWVRTWDTENATAQPNRLPSQVKIRLTVTDDQRPGETITFATRAEVPIRFGLNHAIYNP
jgi:general secretion pathway protein J